MATLTRLDPGGLDDYPWNHRAVGLHAACHMMHTSGAVTRAGIIPSAGAPLQVVPGPGGGLNITVKAGAYWLPASDPARGGYVLTLPTDTTLAHTTPNASQARNDLVIVEVVDDGLAPQADGGTAPYGTSDARIRIVPGNPVAGAPKPTTNWLTPVPGTGVVLSNGGWAELATVNIPAAAGAGAIGQITNVNQRTVAAGGVVPLATAAGITALNDGQVFYLESTRRLGVRTLTGWDYYVPDVAGEIGWQSNITVPATLAYNLGALAGKEYGAQGTPPATLNGVLGLITPTATGRYTLDVSAWIDAASPNSWMSVVTDQGEFIYAFDQLGRSSASKTGTMTLGSNWVVTFKNNEPAARTVSFNVHITRNN